MLEFSNRSERQSIGEFILPGRKQHSLNRGLISWRNLFALVQKSHYKSGNVHKLEAAVKLYTGLARANVVRDQVISKLFSMLLHPFPSVGCAWLHLLMSCEVFCLPSVVQIRNATAVGLFIITDLQELRRVNWSGSTKMLKKVVQDIRQHLDTNRQSM